MAASAVSGDLASAMFAFTVDFYKQLLSEGDGTKNLVFSPFSIAAALSMTLAGARQQTAHEIATVMHTKDDLIHTQFSEFLTKGLAYSPSVTLEIANRMYAENTFKILDEYLATLTKFYNSTVVPVSFTKEAEEVRIAINAWVAEATKSKIKDLLPSLSLDSQTVLVLINAIYFKGLWNEQFNPRVTSLQKFFVSKDTTKDVHMMYKQSHFKINTECSDLSANAIEIPYKGGNTSMVILLPYEVDGLPKLEAALTPSKLLDVMKGMDSTIVDLSLPRFKIELSVDLKKTLRAMGVKDLFTDKADLSGIDGKKDLFISAAFHKAFVEVNEEGTEAAAATAVVATARCAIIGIPFAVDHPFMFFIRSPDPDVILFAGSVRDI